jgi:hypothetical protein
VSFKIWNDSDAGHKTRIEIDGEDVSRYFSSLSITAGVRDAVKIELDIPAGERGWMRSEDPATLVFPIDGTRELLIKHGWTPPPVDAVVEVQPAVELHA